MPETMIGSAVVADQAVKVWDYEVLSVHARHHDVLQEKLTEQGQEGWELVFMTVPMPNEYLCVFRRSRK